MKYLLKLANPQLIYSISIKKLIYFNLQRKKIKCVRQYIVFQTSFRWMSAKKFEEHSFKLENSIKDHSVP